ncbi:unnamed protein product [marine sediment metagenome]|uniref:Uncharacterized protein n=1 Tax=marine sediment metagenome TaxID=412755 RepID=X1UD92_9ZZZZ
MFLWGGVFSLKNWKYQPFVSGLTLRYSSSQPTANPGRGSEGSLPRQWAGKTERVV